MLWRLHYISTSDVEIMLVILDSLILQLLLVGWALMAKKSQSNQEKTKSLPKMVSLAGVCLPSYPAQNRKAHSWRGPCIKSAKQGEKSVKGLLCNGHRLRPADEYY